MKRRGSLADQLSALRKFITEPDHQPEPVETNWSVVPANDNNSEDIAEMKIERLWDISPSPEEIMRQVNRGPVQQNDKGQIIGIGRLRFSDGSQTEQGFKLTIDGNVVAAQIRMPTGAMLGSVDKERAQRGGDENPEEATSTKNYFAGPKTDYRPAGLFAARFSKPVRKNPRKPRTGPKTKEEAKQWLAEAIANTPVMPTVKKCPDGFPALPNSLAQLFPGLVKVATGASGSMAWQDIVSEREDRVEFYRWVDELKEEDRAVLTASKTAQTFTDVGKASGQAPEYARRKGGRRAMISANDNLMTAMKKYAS